jgi:hypothetical protein
MGPYYQREWDDLKELGFTLRKGFVKEKYIIINIETMEQLLDFEKKYGKIAIETDDYEKDIYNLYIHFYIE